MGPLGRISCGRSPHNRCRNCRTSLFFRVNNRLLNLVVAGSSGTICVDNEKFKEKLASEVLLQSLLWQTEVLFTVTIIANSTSIFVIDCDNEETCLIENSCNFTCCDP